MLRSMVGKIDGCKCTYIVLCAPMFDIDPHVTHLPLSFLERWCELCGLSLIRPQSELSKVLLSSQSRDFFLKLLVLHLHKTSFLIYISI